MNSFNYFENEIKRSSVYTLIAEGAAYLTKTTTSSPEFLKSINQTVYEKSAELFVEAP